MSNFWAGVTNALPGTIVSAVISGVLLVYLRKYIDDKWKKQEERRRSDLEVRKKRSVLEQERRRAAGRLFFWLHHAVVKPPANGELEEAMKAYTEAEEKQKDLDRQILADYELRQSGKGV